MEQNLIAVHTEEIKKVETLGEKTLKENKFFSYLDYLLNDPVCREFINEYFSDWDSVKTSIMFIKTYQIVENQMNNILISNDLDKRKLMIGLVKELIDNSTSRREIVKNMTSFMNDDWSACNQVCSEMVNRLSLK
jgi:hypothetical protein